MTDHTKLTDGARSRFRASSVLGGTEELDAGRIEEGVEIQIANDHGDVGYMVMSPQDAARFRDWLNAMPDGPPLTPRGGGRA